MTRVEHINNPDAPAANSIVVAVTVFVLNDANQVLLIQRSDNGLWALPGGAQDFGEDVSSAAMRETLEESGIHVTVCGLVGIYSDPNHRVEFSDGEVRQQFSICFRGAPVGGAPTTSAESTAVRWVDQGALNSLEINPSMRLRIDHGFMNRPEPYIG